MELLLQLSTLDGCCHVETPEVQNLACCFPRPLIIGNVLFSLKTGKKLPKLMRYVQVATTTRHGRRAGRRMHHVAKKGAIFVVVF